MNAALQKFDDQCHGEYIASALVQDIATAAAEQVYDNAMAALVTPFAAAASLQDVLRLVNWAQTTADKCDSLQDSGCCDASEEEPAAAEIDTWARGHVPTRAKTRPSYEMLQQLKMDSQSAGPGSDGGRSGRSGKSGKSATYRRATPRNASRLASQGSSLNRGQMSAAMSEEHAAAAAATTAEPQQTAAALAKDMAAFLGGASSVAAAAADKGEASKHRALESARRAETERRATAAAAERAAAERLEKAIRYAILRSIQCLKFIMLFYFVMAAML
jgi:hypothetical protein